MHSPPAINDWTRVHRKLSPPGLIAAAAGCTVCTGESDSSTHQIDSRVRLASTDPQLRVRFSSQIWWPPVLAHAEAEHDLDPRTERRGSCSRRRDERLTLDHRSLGHSASNEPKAC